MASRKAPEPSRSGIRYSRVTLEPRPEIGLEKTVIEERGLRSLRRHIYDNPVVNLMQAVLDGNPAWEHYNFLFQRANKLLKAAGERGYTDVLLEAERTVEAERTAPNGPSNTQKAILLWCDEIMDRHGHLSEIGTAAHFLVQADNLSAFLPDNARGAWPAIIELCDAYHWLAMEEDGLHRLAVMGTQWKRGQTLAPAKARIKKQITNVIVEAAYRKYCGGEPRVSRHQASTAAGEILDDVNKELTRNRLPSYQEGTLRKAIGAVIRADKARAKNGTMAERAKTPRDR
jgi:hypothetical protein